MSLVRKAGGAGSEGYWITPCLLVQLFYHLGVTKGMKKGFKRYAVGALTAVLGAALILSGCTSKPAESPKTETPKAEGPIVGGTYIYTTIADAKTMISTLVSDTASSFVTGFVYDPLLTQDDKFNYLPAVAESYKIDQDKIYTFNLRKDLKFHDGTPLTADDVLFTFLTIAHPKYTGPRFDDFMGIKGWTELGEAYEKIGKDLKDKKIDEKTADDKKLEAYNNFVKTGGMSTPDKNTFRVELKEPFAPMLNNLIGYGIMPKAKLEGKIGDLKNAPEAKKPIGTGAYKFVEWVKDDHIILERNPDWKIGPKAHTANIQRIIVKTIPDSQANMVALETMETDYAGITPDNFDRFKKDVKHVNVKEWVAFSYTYLGYELNNPMFSDVNVRRAITHAINRQEIVDKLLLGHGKVANSHNSPVRWDYAPDTPSYEYSPDKANALLDAAGWKMGPDGIRVKNGQKFAFEIATNNGNKIREQTAVIIQQALKKVGLEVKINLMEWNAFLDYVDGDKKQAYILGWSLGSEPDGAYGIFHSKGSWNSTHYNNPKVDAAIERGRTVTDKAERTKAYQEMQKYLAEDQAYTFLFYPNSIAGVNTRVMGTSEQFTPAGAHWNFEDWWLSDAKSAK